jgi:hypothetical protein
LPPGLGCDAPPSIIHFGSTVTACSLTSGASSSLVPGGVLPSIACLRAAPPLAPRIVVARTAEGTVTADRTLEGTTAAAKT